MTTLQIKQSHNDLPNNTTIYSTVSNFSKKFGHRGIPLILQRGIAAIALLVASPFLLLTMLLIKMESQ